MGKKKKKKKKRREEIGEVEVKFVPISKQRLESLGDTDVRNVSDLTNGKKEKVQLKSTVSLPFPMDGLQSDEEEGRHHKKKRKKHKRRYSLVIDTNQDNIG